MPPTGDIPVNPREAPKGLEVAERVLPLVHVAEEIRAFRHVIAQNERLTRGDDRDEVALVPVPSGLDLDDLPQGDEEGVGIRHRFIQRLRRKKVVDGLRDVPKDVDGIVPLRHFAKPEQLRSDFLPERGEVIPLSGGVRLGQKGEELRVDENISGRQRVELDRLLSGPGTADELFAGPRLRIVRDVQEKLFEEGWLGHESASLARLIPFSEAGWAVAPESNRLPVTTAQGRPPVVVVTEAIP